MERFLQPEEFNLDDIFKGKYDIPIYQRPYSWGVPQTKQLLKDIDEAFYEYKNDIANPEDSILFAGTIFIKTENNVRNEYNEYTVVDGQQRITTFTLIFMCLLNHLYLINSDDDILNEIKNYLWKKESRKPDKNRRVLELGNIDKNIMRVIFDKLFSKEDIVLFAKTHLLESQNEIENNLLNNLIYIDEHLKILEDEQQYFDFIDFIKYNVKVISIKINANMGKLFSIFESINSKGKPLDDIDLIKSYIFQNLKQEDYDEYLEKWGKLIEKTNDNLGDYLTIYIRANISYYKTSIKLDNFRTLTEDQLKTYYDKDNIDDVLKQFINDMLVNVKYYSMLYDLNEINTSHLSAKAKTIFIMNKIAKYNHTEPLFFKLLILRERGLATDKFELLISYAFRFILTFQTISSRESKQTIKIFSEVQNELYRANDNIDKNTIDNILYVFNKIIADNVISNLGLRDSIRNTMTYKKNKDVVKILLSYLSSIDKDGNVNYLILKSLLEAGKDLHIDHILPLSPKENDMNYRYYVVENTMVLKNGQDFTQDASVERMPVNDFYNYYLHFIGNLRLEWANENIRKSNHLINLEEFDESFNTFKQIKDRGENIIADIVNSNFLISTDNIDYSPSKMKSKRVIDLKGYNSEEISYTNYHPISFHLFDEAVTLDKFTYQELLTEIFDQLYDLEKDRLIELAKEGYKPTTSNRNYISDCKDDVRKPYVLGNNVFVETNLSPQYMMLMFYGVIDLMGLETKDLVIHLEEK